LHKVIDLTLSEDSQGI